MSSSLIESTACGLLPIVTDMPASKKIIEDGVNGFLIDDIETGKLSDVMLNAVEKYREMEAELTKNSARIKKAFNRTENQKAFIEKYQELL
jgi:glycosyltransferase involved in cell wall biosynthesis